MQIHLMSDLHLEFGGKVHLTGGDVLILAGDIFIASHFKKSEASPYHAIAITYDDFMNEAFKLYSVIIMVMGNHEHYSGEFTESAKLIRARYPGLILLDNEFVELEGQRFFGGTMWTDMNAHNPLVMMRARDSMNDFKVIKNRHIKFLPRDSIESHRSFMYALNESYTPGMVVISHHAPSWQSLDPRYAGDALNSCYATDLNHWILDKDIKAWCHGHLHNSSDYMIGETRVLCNPRGYHGFELNRGFSTCSF